MRAPLLRRLHADRTGATIIEFALVAPMFMVLLLGVMDIGQMVYGRAVLGGAVHAAARSSALETRDTAAADAMVLGMIRPVLPGVTIAATRRSYYDFSDIGRAEKWNDANANGGCDTGETYTDENRNGTWDADIGATGAGGANDVVIYTVVASYTPTFKVPLLPELWTRRSLTATAVTKNQPFAAQNGYGSSAGTCA